MHDFVCDSPETTILVQDRFWCGLKRASFKVGLIVLTAKVYVKAMLGYLKRKDIITYFNAEL